MTTHTPGPWLLDHERVLDPNRGVVALITSEDGKVVEWPVIVGFNSADADADAETEANAKLIASAPALLEALEELVIANHGWPMEPKDEADSVCRSALVQARAAIAAARGSSLSEGDVT